MSRDNVVFYAAGMYFMEDGALVDIERDGTDKLRVGHVWVVCNGLVCHKGDYDKADGSQWTPIIFDDRVQVAYRNMLSNLILEEA